MKRISKSLVTAALAVLSAHVFPTAFDITSDIELGGWADSSDADVRIDGHSLPLARAGRSRKELDASPARRSRPRIADQEEIVQRTSS